MTISQILSRIQVKMLTFHHKSVAALVTLIVAEYIFYMIGALLVKIDYTSIFIAPKYG